MHCLNKQAVQSQDFGSSSNEQTRVTVVRYRQAQREHVHCVSSYNLTWPHRKIKLQLVICCLCKLCRCGHMGRRRGSVFQSINELLREALTARFCGRCRARWGAEAWFARRGCAANGVLIPDHAAACFVNQTV